MSGNRIEWSRIMTNSTTSSMPEPFKWDYTNVNNDFIPNL